VPNLAIVLSSLQESGVRLWVDSGDLRCEAPRGVLCPEQIALLRELKQEFICELSGLPPCPRSRRDLLLPLAIQHETFLDMCRQYPNWSFFSSTALRLRGVVNVEFLRRSLELVVWRHECLRARIVLRNGLARQQIAEPCEVSLDVLSVPSRIEQGAEDFIEDICNRPTDFGTGSLYKFGLLRTSEYDHVLIVAIHHSVSDAVSFGLFFREFWYLYEQFLGGREPWLPEMILQYPDYAIWQRLVYFSTMRKHGDYWVRRLKGATPVRMPISRSENSIYFILGESQVALGEILSARLQAFARCNSTSPSMIILALYAALVSRWCNQSDFVLGFVVTGRFRSEHVNMMGLLVSDVAIRMQLCGDETFVDMVEIASREFVAAYEHIDFGTTTCSGSGDVFKGTSLSWLGDFDEIAGVPAGLGCNFIGPNLNVEPLRMRNARMEDGVPENFDLGSQMLWQFMNTPRGIVGRAYYNAALFPAHSMRRFVKHLQHIAEHMVHNPLARVSGFQVSN
jgi:hypothetical protein